MPICQVSSKPFIAKAAALTFAAWYTLHLASPANAVDATDFFKALQTEAGKNGNTVTFESLQASGADGAVATGIEIINTKNGDRLTISEMTLSGTQVLANDGFSFERMAANDVSLVAAPRPNANKGSNGGSITLGAVSAEDFSVLPIENRENPFWPLDLGNAQIDTIRILATGKDNISLSIPSFSINGLQHTDDVSFTMGNARLAAGSGTFAAENGANGTFTTGEIDVSQLARIGQGGFQIGSFDMGPIRLSGADEYDREISLIFEGMNGSNLFSPDYLGEGDLVFSEDEMRVTFGSVRFSLDGTELVTLQGGESIAKYDGATKDYRFSGVFDDLYIDVKSIPVEPGQEQGKQRFEALGYDDITMDVSINGFWNVGSGLLNMESYKFDAENMAAFDMSLKLGGYTVAFARKLQQISQNMNEADDLELKQALSMQMLAEMAALSVEELTVSLEDKSLTRRIMRQQAQKSGQTAEDMAAALPFMAGAALAQLDVPEFAASVSSAIAAYFTSVLNDQGSLTLSAKPDEPVSFAEVMGIAAGIRAGNVQPSEVIERLNLTISGE